MKFRMFILLLTLYVGAIFLTSCGDDDPSPVDNKTIEQKLEECMNQIRGTPVFTQDQYGNIVRWIGCTRP